MNKGYWLVRADITNKEKFSEYVQRIPSIIKQYGGRYLVRAGNSECVEGSTRSRNTIIEFPSYQAAVDCWNSPEYQSAKSLRSGAADLDIVLIEGCEQN